MAAPEHFEAVIAQIAREGFGGVVAAEEPWFFAHRAKLITAIDRYRLPAGYPFREFVEAGGLLSYSSILADFAVRGAVYVGKILGGEKPANLPVEGPTKFELVINMKTAKALGLTVPPSLLLRAAEVIH